VTAANLRKIDGTGWLPVELSKIGGGSPISHVPTDPTNTIASVASVSASDLVYRYACLSTNMTIEIDANLESDAYTTGTGNLETTDRGNNDNLYAGGTNLSILGTGTDF